jgi:hypothetical protein
VPRELRLMINSDPTPGINLVEIEFGERYRDGGKLPREELVSRGW